MKKSVVKRSSKLGGCGCGGASLSGCGCGSSAPRRSLSGARCGCGGECCKKASLGSYSAGGQTRACNCPCPNCLMAQHTQTQRAKAPQSQTTNYHPSAYPPRARAGLFDPRAFQQAWPEPNTNPLIPYTFGRQPRSMEISYLQPTPSITFDPRLYTPQWPDVAPEPSVRFPLLNVSCDSGPSQPYNVQPLSGMGRRARHSMGAISNKTAKALKIVEEELASMARLDSSSDSYFKYRGGKIGGSIGEKISTPEDGNKFDELKYAINPSNMMLPVSVLDKPYAAVFGFVPVPDTIRSRKIELYVRWGGPENIRKESSINVVDFIEDKQYSDRIYIDNLINDDDYINFTASSAPERRNLSYGADLTQRGLKAYANEIGFIYPFKISYNDNFEIIIEQFFKGDDDKGQYVNITDNANSFLNFIMRSYFKIIQSIAIRDGFTKEKRIEKMSEIAKFLSGKDYVNNLRLFANTIIERLLHDMKNAVLLAALTSGTTLKNAKDLPMVQFLYQASSNPNARFSRVLEGDTTIATLVSKFNSSIKKSSEFISSFTNNISEVPDLFKVVLSAATADIAEQVRSGVAAATESLTADKLAAETARTNAIADLNAFKKTSEKEINALRSKYEGMSTSTKVGMAVGALAGAYTAYRYASEQSELTQNERIATAAIGGVLGMLPIVNLLTIPFAGMFAGNIFKAGKSETAQRLATSAVDYGSGLVSRYTSGGEVQTAPLALPAPSEPVSVEASSSAPARPKKKKSASVSEAVPVAGYPARRRK